MIALLTLAGGFDKIAKSMKIRLRIVILLLILLIILQFPVFYKFWLAQMGGLLIHQDKIEPADAILVLGGGRGERVLQGAELFNKKYAGTIIFTGEYGQELFAERFHWALQAQKLAASCGVPVNST